MSIHRSVTLAVAFVLVAPVALAQTKSTETKADGAKAEVKSDAKKVDAKATQTKADAKKAPAKADAKQADDTDAKSADHKPAADATTSRIDPGIPASDTPSTNDPSRATDSKKQVAPQTTTIAGQKAVNKDEDLDVAIGKAETTSAQPGTRDVIESRAEARREGEGRRITAAPLAGYGGAGLGVGVGARAGYTFDIPVYVGATFMYHAGKDGQDTRAGVTDSSNAFYYPGAEVGYDIGLGPVLVRPYVGAGVLLGRFSTTTTNGIESTNTEKALMVYPGVTAHYIIGRSPVFVGADARVLLPFENQAAAPSLFGTAGLHL